MAGRGPTVVDASVAVKWFLPERDTPKALALRDAHVDSETTLVAPLLLLYEVANALRYHPQVGADLLARHMEDLFALGIGFDVPSEESLGDAVRVAYERGVSVYDAAYLSLADRLDARLVTADREQLAAAGPRGLDLDAWG